MPIQSVLMIRASLIYLLAVFGLGGLMLANKAVDLHPSFISFTQIHIELGLFGWLLQFIMGTAYWMLPRYLKGPKRGNNAIAWFMVVLLNGGIGIYLLSLLGLFSDYGLLAGRCMELLAVACFIVLHWNRVVPYRRGQR
ncbi:MAG: hypothetical protein R3224_07355 [Balneolaceae bacterium]|nr:hypothetical protein [Balneolaceae bacterium]